MQALSLEACLLPPVPRGHASCVEDRVIAVADHELAPPRPLPCAESVADIPSQHPCLILEQGLKEPDYPPGRLLQVQQRGAGGADGGQDR